MGTGRAPLPAVRQHDVRADLEPQLRRVRADHDGRELRRRGPRPLLRPGRRAARRGRQPPDAGGRRGRDGGAGRRRRARRSRTPSSRVFRAMPDADPAHYVRGQYDGYRDDRRRRRRTRPPRPTPRCAWRSTTGAGRACRSSSAPASCLPVTQTELRLVFQRAAAAGLHASAAAAAPSPNQLVVKLDPSTGIRLIVDAQRADAPSPRRSRWTWSSPRRAARAPTPYEVLLHAAMQRRQHALHPPGRRRGDLADHAAAARRAAAGAPVRARDRGARRRPTSCWPATAAGTSPWVAS